MDGEKVVLITGSGSLAGSIARRLLASGFEVISAESCPVDPFLNDGYIEISCDELHLDLINKAQVKSSIKRSRGKGKKIKPWENNFPGN